MKKQNALEGSMKDIVTKSYFMKNKLTSKMNKYHANPQIFLL
jgi:hypothetical protein